MQQELRSRGRVQVYMAWKLPSQFDFSHIPGPVFSHTEKRQLPQDAFARTGRPLQGTRGQEPDLFEVSFLQDSETSTVIPIHPHLERGIPPGTCELGQQ